MDMLTAELKRVVGQAGDAPVRLTDPETHRSYVIVSAEVYERLLLSAQEHSEREPWMPAAKDARASLTHDDPQLSWDGFVDWSAPSL
jgi:hypothetical protein